MARDDVKFIHYKIGQPSSADWIPIVWCRSKYLIFHHTHRVLSLVQYNK